MKPAVSELLRGQTRSRPGHSPSQFTSALGNHLRDCSAILVVGTPIYAWLEVHGIGLTPVVSLRVRCMNALFLVSGLGWIIARGRDYSHRLFGIQPGRSRERVLIAHDLLFLVVINGLLAPPFYLLSGASFRGVARGTALAMIVSVLTGPLNGISIDSFRELRGSVATSRLPARVRNQPTTVRQGLVLVVMAFSVFFVLASYLA